MTIISFAPGVCSLLAKRGADSGTVRLMNKAVEEKFWSKVEKTDGCWKWNGGKLRLGYGLFYINSVMIMAHTVSYELLVGKIPKGLELDHLCRNPNCVNPSHLEAVTHRVNVLRSTSPPSMNAKKTHCMRGHLLEGENLRKDMLPRRVCIICHRGWSTRNRQAKPNYKPSAHWASMTEAERKIKMDELRKPIKRAQKYAK